ncbi:MAG: hypothetical protein AB1671_08395 [Thermodesulfobacteriota bacterium]
MARLLQWCRRGEIQRRRAGRHPTHIACAAIPSFLQGEVLIGPLLSEHGTPGLLLLQVSPSPHPPLCPP